MKIVIAAGGTGGHLYPAVALAREFIREEPETGVLFVGTARGIEAGVLSHEGFELQSIKALPVMGVGLGGALCALRALPVGLWQSLRILRTRRPDVVIAIGGYGSPAVIIAAFLLRIPRVLLEPNAYAGLANRVLGPFAHRVFVAFESATSGFSRRKVRVVGSPIRREFMQQGGDASRVARNGRSVLLVFGGSQGARPINDAMIEALPYLGSLRERMVVVHQTGDADRQRVQDAYQGAGFRAQVLPFLFDMPQRLQAATLVVARAGAITLAEITASGKVAVLIPLPHAIYDHQAHNAQVLESAGAAMVVPQSVLSGERLARVVQDLLSDPERLRQMSERSRRLGRTDSAEVIVRECMALVKKRSAVSGQPTAQT